MYNVIWMSEFFFFVFYQFQTSSSECGSTFLCGKLDCCVWDLSVMCVIICFNPIQQSSINLADIIKEVGYTATAS